MRPRRRNPSSPAQAPSPKPQHPSIESINPTSGQQPTSEFAPSSRKNLKFLTARCSYALCKGSALVSQCNITSIPHFHLLKRGISLEPCFCRVFIVGIHQIFKWIFWEADLLLYIHDHKVEGKHQ
ncbi:uncharacterized protein [Elaeis guineensis]|uniref:uncharacterized protein isoform X2 n=1 Tax=Elaeis guineensis var. tenera TaxID=51953 RepID=UPI003C6D4E7C